MPFLMHDYIHNECFNPDVHLVIHTGEREREERKVNLVN